MKKLIAILAALLLLTGGIVVSEENISVSGCGRMWSGKNFAHGMCGNSCEYTDADNDGVCDHASENNCGMRANIGCGMMSGGCRRRVMQQSGCMQGGCAYR